MLFQSRALNKIHHQVPAPGLAKVIVDAREVGMHHSTQQKRFTFKGLGGLFNFLGIQPLLAHFLDGYESIAKFAVLGLVDSAKASLPQLAQNTIALPQKRSWR